MKSFLESSACNGVRPKSVAKTSLLQRNELLALLMADRGRVRYIVAPNGFGKTALVGLYAHMNYEFRDTSWISGKSPCFLRDLDAGILASGVMKFIDEGGLVVIEDVPSLSAQRVLALWEACMQLIQAGREVVVTATPGSNPLKRHRRACLFIDSHALLLTDEEVAYLHAADPMRIAGAIPACSAQRVAGLVGATEREQQMFLTDAIVDSSARQRALLFLMLVLQEGRIDILGRLMASDSGLDSYQLKEEFPFISIESTEHSFRAGEFSIEIVLHAFQPYLREIAATCGSDDAGRLALRVADALLKQQMYERAVQVIIELCSPYQRAEWLAEHQWKLMNDGVLLPLEELYRSLEGRREQQGAVFIVGSAVRKALLGEEATSMRTLIRTGHMGGVHLSVRLIASSAALLLSQEVDRTLEALFSRSFSVEGSRADSIDKRLEPLAVFWGNLRDRAKVLSAVLDALRDKPASRTCAVAALACALKVTPEIDEPTRDRAREAIDYLIPGEGERSGASLMDSMLLHEAHACGIEGCLAYNQSLDTIDMRLHSQRSIFKRRYANALADAAQIAGQLVSPALLMDTAAPKLRITLMGGLQLRQGETMLQGNSFSRQSDRTLLALLVLNAGKDLSCVHLAESLWPESPLPKASHSLSNALSRLKAGISLSNGDCPYLVRNRGTVRMRKDLIESDVLIIQELCKSFALDDLTLDQTVELVEQIRDVYGGDLLPGDEDCLLLMHERMRLKERAVEIMLEISSRLEAVGRVRKGLDFARQALAWDPDRDDCYGQLMYMQAQAGQRPAALWTWKQYVFHMRSLGLDPSTRMHNLYLHIITEEDFDDDPDDDDDDENTLFFARL